MTTTIVTRATKGGRLSFTDMDNNLLNLKATADAAAVQATTYTKTEVDAAITSSTPSFSTLTGKPTTVTGYGITDSMTASAISTAIGVETSRATTAESLLAPKASPTFTGTVSGITAAMVGLGNVTNVAQLAATQTHAITGDVTAPATALSTGTIATTLANSGVTAGTVNNSATTVTPITVDAKGRVTATGTAVTITPAFSSITSKPTTLSGYGITDAITSTDTTTAIGVETTRATAAEAALTTALNAAVARITALENALLSITWSTSI